MTPRALELEITDFGPIVEARVDLRPLTVFVGPSNTGKSYLATLIYALHRTLALSLGDYLGARVLRFLLPRSRQRLSEAGLDALSEVVRAVVGASEPSGRDSIVLSPPAADALRSSFDDLAGALSAEIGRCFGVGEPRTLIRRGTASSARVVIRRRISDRAGLAEHRFSLSERPEFRTVVPEGVPIPVGSDRFRQSALDLPPRYFDEAKRNESLLSWGGDLVLPSLFDPLHLSAYYLPAGRTGLMHAFNVVVSALIASAPTPSVRAASRTAMLTGVVADFLDQLVRIDWLGLGNPASERKLGSRIEAGILGGSVRIHRSPPTDYPRFAYRPRGWKEDLALANASSMVSELTPVVLYLRHRIGPDKVLIVEEPESHLHPAMQVKLMRELARLVGAGVRVIVTTHSEWLLDELANIVRRAELPEAERGGRIALCHDQVGAWLFQPKERPRGSIVEEIRLDDSGLYPSGYDAVASALHNDWADITSRIETDS